MQTPPHVDRADVALAEGDFAQLNDEHLELQSAITDLAGARERQAAVEIECSAAQAELEGLREGELAAEKAAEARVHRRERADGSVELARRARSAGEAKVVWKEAARTRAQFEVALAEARERLARANLEQARLNLLRKAGSPAADRYHPEGFAQAVERARSDHADARERFQDALAAERAARAEYERLEGTAPGT